MTIAKKVEEEKWDEFFEAYGNAPDEDLIGMIWSRCADMGSEQGALMSVKRVQMFTNGILEWKKQVEEEARKEGIRMFHKEVTNNTLISELSGWPSILDYSKDRLLENLNLNTK